MGFFSAGLNLNYGVKRLDDRAMIRVDTCIQAPLTFKGMPVVPSELCVISGTSIKKWRRLNRPPKVRVRSFNKYPMYLAKPPMVPEPTWICHPKVYEKIKARRK